MKLKKSKIGRAAHIKNSTIGTSNEISFSVLDAAKAAQDDEQRRSGKRPRFPRPNLGGIPLFTLGRGKKPIATPTKESGLPLSTGEFVSADGVQATSSTPRTVPGIATDAPGAGDAAAAGGRAGNSNNSPALASSGASGAIGSTVHGGAAASARERKTPAASTWQTPFDEVARRKAARKKKRGIVIGVIAACAVCVAAAGGVMLYSGMQAHSEKITQLSQAADVIDEANESVTRLNELVVKVSSTSVDQLSSAEITQSLDEMSADLDAAEESLLSTKQSVEEMQRAFSDARDKEAVNQAIALVNARINMIDSGRDVVEAARVGVQSYEEAEEAWNRLLEADSLARDAANLVTDTSVDNVNASISKTNEAIAAFNDARDGLSALEEPYLDDVRAYISYIDLRLEAQQFALESDQAYLNRNKEEAAAANDSYNAKDSEAVVAIREQQKDPLELVSERFSAVLDPLKASYENERAMAERSSQALNDYLGRVSK